MVDAVNIARLKHWNTLIWSWLLKVHAKDRKQETHKLWYTSLNHTNSFFLAETLSHIPAVEFFFCHRGRSCLGGAPQHARGTKWTHLWHRVGITQNRNAKSTEPRNPSGKFSILTCLEPTETKTNIQKNLLSKIDNLETSLPPLETFFPLFHKRQASAACIIRTATLLGSLFLARNFSSQLSNTKLCQ